MTFKQQLLGMFFLFGCEQNANKVNSVVEYEYLSLDGEYSKEVMDWLNEARKTNELHGLSVEDGEEYVYGKGYSQAKVSYTLKI